MIPFLIICPQWSDTQYQVFALRNHPPSALSAFAKSRNPITTETAHGVLKSSPEYPPKNHRRFVIE
jgi:hypothetical protein